MKVLIDIAISKILGGNPKFICLRLFKNLLTISFLIFLMACGRAGDQELADKENQPIGMEYVSGDNQSHYAGFLFPQELVVKTYAGNKGLSGFKIRFSEVTSTGASILTPVTTTTTNGIAKTKILPSAYSTGTVQIKAEIIEGDKGDFANNFSPITFNLTAEQGAHHIEYVQGDSQSVVVNQVAPISPTVRVVDANNAIIAGWPVTWTITSGGGSITVNTQTDASGLASVNWTV